MIHIEKFVKETVCFSTLDHDAFPHLLEGSVQDPECASIKITIYRLAKILW